MRLWIRATRSFAWQVITAKVRVQSPDFGFFQFSQIAATPNARRSRRPTAKGCLGPWPEGRRHSKKLSTGRTQRSEEHTSELQSLMRISYAVFCLKKKKNKKRRYTKLCLQHTKHTTQLQKTNERGPLSKHQTI